MSEYKPQKLTEFSFKPVEKVSEHKDGAGPAAQRDSYTDLLDEIPKGSSSHDTPILFDPPRV